MPQFSDISKFRLSTCHPDLVTLFNEVIKYRDCSVLVGYRAEKEQEQAFTDGKTKLHYPDSKHNKKPSMAVDVAPCPIVWGKTDNFIYFAGFVLGIAKMLKIQGKITHEIRYGGNWKMDNDVFDNVFNDLDHFEIMG